MANSSPMKKSSFYGKSTLSSATWKRRLAHQEKDFKQNKLPVEYHGRIDGPPTDWKCFYRQEEAFAYVKRKGQGLSVFSYESTSFEKPQGKRLYLTASYEQFWHYYKQLPDDKRYHYEVIGHGCVCHLYFDLEFLKSSNTEKDGMVMTGIFIKFICYCLQKVFQVECSVNNVLQLDASTTEKFSHHLIFHLDKIAFQDNIMVGDFVKYSLDILKQIFHGDLAHKNTPNESDIKEIVEHAGQRRKHPVDFECLEPFTYQDLANVGLSKLELSSLMIKDKNGSDVLFCDSGVYTKNRNFRLFMSSKLGKQNPLVLSKANRFKICDGEQNEKQIFMTSLITNVAYTADTRILTFQPDFSASSTSKKQHLKPDANENNSITGYNFSPYPEVDKFILSQANKGGVTGFIRRWSYFPQGELVVYEIGNNRWCENIGRPHKSNNIMLLVDLRSGTFYQKCHDPECKAVNFKSVEMVLPKDALVHHLIDEDDDESDISDHELVAVADKFEHESLNVDENSIEDADLLNAVESLTN